MYTGWLGAYKYFVTLSTLYLNNYFSDDFLLLLVESRYCRYSLACFHSGLLLLKKKRKNTCRYMMLPT